MKLSIIIPCKNEEGNIVKLYEKINETLKKIKYEIIFIDDGSTDETFNMMKECYLKDNKHVKVLSFSRNFRKEAAMIAGLDYSTGDYTCIIDGDLQQNPVLLLDMMDFLDNNIEYDEVSMIMAGRTDSKFMEFLKHKFYKFIDSICDVHFEDSASDFRMFRTNVKTSLINMREKSRFMKGMFPYVGFKVKYFPFSMEQRNSGKTKFGFISCIKLALDGIINYSAFPLKVSGIFGVILLIIAFLYLIISLIANSFNIILFLLLGLFGMQFMFLYLIGLYLYNVQIETKKRPIYIIKESLGIDE